MANDGSTTVMRPVGLVERMHVSRAYLNLDTYVMVFAKYQSDTPLTRETLMAALRKVVQRNCDLAVQVYGEAQNTPVFVRLPSVDLSRIVTFVSDKEADIISVLEMCFVQPTKLESEDPLWRLAVLPDHTVIFQFHHAIGDGQSGLAFHQLLLAALNEVAAEESPVTSEIVPIPDNLAMGPPLEKITDLSVSFSKFCGVMYDILAPPALTKGGSAWTGNPVVNKQLVKNNVRMWHISPAVASALTELCREKKSTLTSFLHIVANSVLADLVTKSSKKSSKRKFKSIASTIPISLRKITGTKPDVLCNYVSTVNIYLPIRRPPKVAKSRTWELYFSWERSAKLAASLRKNVAKSREMPGLLKFLFGKYQKYFTDSLGKKRSLGLEQSNVGRWPGSPPSPDAKWNVDEVYFTQGDPVVGAAIKLNVAGWPSGAVGFTITWGEEAIEDEFAESFVKTFKAAVGSFVKQPETK